MELSVIAGGFTLLPVIQALANRSAAIPLPVAGPDSPTALLQAAWNLVLLAFLMARSPAPLGLSRAVWRPGAADLPRGLALAAILLGLGSLLSLALPQAPGGAMPFTGPAGPGGLVLVGLALALSVSLEELLYRVYYLERLRLLGAGAPAAVGIAVCLFSLGHHYQGITGLVLSLVLGVVLCLAWLRWRRFWPLWLGHLAYNLTVLAASGSQPQA